MDYPEEAIAWAFVVITTVNYAVVAALITRIVLQGRDSRATLAWVFFLLLLPCVGVLAFSILGTNRLRLRRWKRRKVGSTIGMRLKPLAQSKDEIAGAAGFPADPGLLRLVHTLDGMSAQSGNAVTLFRDGKETFAAIEAAIDAAKHHVHLLYYIWESDTTGERLRDALARAAIRGVEVRLLVDDVGSLGTPPSFFQPIVEAGGNIARFFRLGLFGRRLSLNHRNHRKIVVVDGARGFTGGMNVGDTYAGLGEPWQDAHVDVTGPAILRLQEIFCQDWFLTTEEDLALPEYFPIPAQAGDEWVQFVASGPDEKRWHAIHTVLFSAITQARERVWLETPYFIPDGAMALALESAALRGVDVRLLLPGKSDHLMVLHAGRSFYGDLLEAGVRIFEVPRTFLHAKTATIDGRVATVGSANMDQRSFKLNFEANAFFYGPQVAHELELSFKSTQDIAKEITATDFEARGRFRRVLEALARLVGPVL